MTVKAVRNKTTLKKDEFQKFLILKKMILRNYLKLDVFLPKIMINMLLLKLILKK